MSFKEILHFRGTQPFLGGGGGGGDMNSKTLDTLQSHPFIFAEIMNSFRYVSFTHLGWEWQMLDSLLSY